MTMSTYEYSEEQSEAANAALRALEMAHVDHRAETPLGRAMRALLKHAEIRELDRAEQALREAENANVRAWLQAVYPNTAAAHPDVELAEHMRQKYQQNRDYFLKIAAEIVPAEVIEPRTIPHYKDLTLGHRDTEWQDAEGCIWAYGHDLGWGWRSRVSGIFRVSEPQSFPWTEVL